MGRFCYKVLGYYKWLLIVINLLLKENTLKGAFWEFLSVA